MQKKKTSEYEKKFSIANIVIFSSTFVQNNQNNEDLANIYNYITQLDANINELRRQSCTNEQGEEILEKLKNIKPLSNKAYNISNSTSILNETLIIELFEAQSKKIDAIQEKLDSSSKPDNQKLNENDQKTNVMNSHSKNEAMNQQLNYKKIGELQILIEIIIDKLAKLEYVFFKPINFN
jgi:hypothetical protein